MIFTLLFSFFASIHCAYIGVLNNCGRSIEVIRVDEPLNDNATFTVAGLDQGQRKITEGISPFGTVEISVSPEGLTRAVFTNLARALDEYEIDTDAGFDVGMEITAERSLPVGSLRNSEDPLSCPNVTCTDSHLGTSLYKRIWSAAVTGGNFNLTFCP
ncbi:hypothetical protein PRIPAC_87717 [Pristionchus pacificus]|uniref:Uncharacterized protein n=1 Tax=Pristionchus pacificus TaxID=54126 RepID=A0A2A6B6Z7_PRIPA|nr:hypothetical protein PRIPAC_87717 [Pristionchus pacificus]|eukprot:PDM61652.1 hypothetical protein PRIPAC_51094 [Pristionchus pacificus]